MMTSPVVHGDLIYLAVQSYGDSTRTLKFALLEWLDTNQDGKLAREEMPAEFLERFDTSDKNSDGLIDETEIDTAFQHENNQAAGGNTIQAVRGGGTGDVTKTHVVWNIDNKSPSNLSSPLVYRDRLHVVKSGGVSSCFSATDGATIWDRTRLKNFGDYYASPIAADGKVYIAGRNGFVLVLDDSDVHGNGRCVTVPDRVAHSLRHDLHGDVARNRVGGQCLEGPLADCDRDRRDALPGRLDAAHALLPGEPITSGRCHIEKSQ